MRTRTGFPEPALRPVSLLLPVSPSTGARCPQWRWGREAGLCVCCCLLGSLQGFWQREPPARIQLTRTCEIQLPGPQPPAMWRDACEALIATHTWYQILLSVGGLNDPMLDTWPGVGSLKWLLPSPCVGQCNWAIDNMLMVQRDRPAKAGNYKTQT